MTSRASPRPSSPRKATSPVKEAARAPRDGRKKQGDKRGAPPPRPAALPPEESHEVAAALQRADRGWWHRVAAPTRTRSGFVALLGRPNVGKSTLLNALIREKLAATTPRPQTTRKRFRGVLQVGSSQAVLVDTPGLFDGAVLQGTGLAGFGELGTYMAAEARTAAADADVVVWVEEAVPARGGGVPEVTEVQKAIAGMLKNTGRPVVLALNKVDAIPKHILLPYLEAWNAVMPFRAMVPVSALKEDGLDRLLAEVLGLLPEGEPLYPEGQLTDASERAITEEIIREKAMLLTGEEVPYAVAVEVLRFDESRRDAHGRGGGIIDVEATIHVEKEGQKAIVVGAGGKKIKEIGTAARADLEKMLGCRVMLKLFVKVSERWTRSKSSLRGMGYA